MTVRVFQGNDFFLPNKSGRASAHAVEVVIEEGIACETGKHALEITKSFRKIIQKNSVTGEEASKERENLYLWERRILLFKLVAVVT